MTQYRITRRDTDEQFYVEASSYEDAALLAARKISRTRIGVSRVTGDPGKSGIFQGFAPSGQSAESSYGPAFHVF